MAEKPRRARVQKIIKNLLDSEIPEIQSKANKLAAQIKELEEHSSRLRTYITQIENLATDEDNAMTETRIGELLKDLDKALDELKHRSKRSLTTRATGKVSPKKRAAIVQRIEPEMEEMEEVIMEEEVEEVEEEPEESTAGQGMRLETYRTPEGYVIKKSRI
jgi:acyl-CoA reductase-like NAD-dependent aldehyde dehydrogenase